MHGIKQKVILIIATYHPPQLKQPRAVNIKSTKLNTIDCFNRDSCHAAITATTYPCITGITLPATKRKMSSVKGCNNGFRMGT